MIRLLLCLVMSISVPTGLLGLLRWVYGVQARRFNDRVAREFLQDWHERLDLLDPARRKQATAAPPTNILEAQTMVEPSRLWMRGGAAQPTSRL